MAVKFSRFLVAVLISGCFTLAACSVSPEQTGDSVITLTVFAAASLTDAFGEIGSTFGAAHAGTRISFNFAGSQQLKSQIEQGANADLFASADTKNMDALQGEGLLAGAYQVFARNRLAVIVPDSNPAGVESLHDLAKPGLKLVLANPSVPVGSYTLQMLKNLSSDSSYGASFSDTVQSRVVSSETNVKQVVSKVILAEADAGIVYTTDAEVAKGKVQVIDIPDPFNVIATYPIAVLRTSRQLTLSQQFMDWVLSDNGRSVLKKSGFQ